MTVWELLGFVGLVLGGLSAVACTGLLVLCALALIGDARVARRAARLRELGESERRRARAGEAMARRAGRPAGCGVRPVPADGSPAARVRRRRGGGWVA